MDVLSAIVSHVMYSEHKQLLIYGVYLCAGFLVPLSICTFSVSGTSNAGFNAMLTTLLNITHVVASHHLVQNGGSPIAVGFLIGVSGMLAAVNLMASIFWGQLSGCVAVVEEIPGYSCTSPGAYTAVCVFSVFLFLSQVAFTGAVVTWRGEIIKNDEDDRGYDGVAQSDHGGQGQRMSTVASVDL